MNSLPNNEPIELLSYLTKQEREELEAILAATPDPMTIITSIIRPDRSIEGYLLGTADGYVEMPPDHPLLVGMPPATPVSANGGYREGERP
jgi:adenosine/AMP kinase